MDEQNRFTTIRSHGKSLVLRKLSSTELVMRRPPNFLGTGRVLSAVLLEGETLEMWLESQNLKQQKV